MQRLTLEQARVQEDGDGWEMYIYVFHHGEVYFYIGISDQPYTRLEQHIGEGTCTHSPSSLGELIINNWPVSLQWFMDVYTLQELAPDAYAQLQEQHAEPRRYRTIAERVERWLIREYKPCLNSMRSRGKGLLPEKYQWKHIANAGVKITGED